MLSVVIIARDEADRLGRCLRSLPDGAETIVVVDAATTDDTAGVAHREGAQVIERVWPGHVAQKNFALSLATRPFTLSLDADEWLTPHAREAIATIAHAPTSVTGWSLVRRNEWLGKQLRGGRFGRERKIRVVRTGAGRFVGDDPHDRLVTDGAVARLPGAIGHAPYRTVWEHLNTIERYSSRHAATLQERGVRARAWDPYVRPTLHFVDTFLLRSAWRDGVDGLAVALLGTAHAHLKWRRLRRGQA